MARMRNERSEEDPKDIVRMIANKTNETNKSAIASGEEDMGKEKEEKEGGRKGDRVNEGSWGRRSCG